MRFATLRHNGSNAAAVREGDEYSILPYGDVSELLRSGVGLDTLTPIAKVPVSAADYAPVVTTASKVICLGLNYQDHVAEMGRKSAGVPTLFAKYSETLMGAFDDLVLPPISATVDWEVELGVIIGRKARNVSLEEAESHIAGFTVVNDVSMRDFQRRTSQFLQGKMFEATTPVGPEMVTPDEVDLARDLRVTTVLDGEIMQDSRTSHHITTVAEAISYISSIITLQPGDLILMGTPGGVGDGRDPKVFMKPGQTLVTRIEGIGEMRNSVIAG